MIAGEAVQRSVVVETCQKSADFITHWYEKACILVKSPESMTGERG